jgi:hypothetical protein
MATKDDFPQDALAQLVAKHPLLFHNQTPYASHVPVGCLPLADALCTDLEMILGDRCNQFEVRQVKEKWAALRFYWAIRGAETPLHADIGGVHPKVPQPRSQPDEQGFRRRVAETQLGLHLTLSPDTPQATAIVERIERAEDASTLTCEWCGQPGQLWVAGHGGPGNHCTACPVHKGDGALSKVLCVPQHITLKSDNKSGRPTPAPPAASN